MKNYKVILIAFLIGVTTFCVHKYLVTLKEKYDLLGTLSEIKNQVVGLENEKQNLLQSLDKEKQGRQKAEQEKLTLEDDLKATAERIAKLEASYIEAWDSSEKLKTQITALNSEKEELAKKLVQSSQENDTLKARLSSIAELRKALLALERKAQEVEANLDAAGNRGVVQKKVKIEVTPVQKSGK